MKSIAGLALLGFAAAGIHTAWLPAGDVRPLADAVEGWDGGYRLRQSDGDAECEITRQGLSRKGLSPLEAAAACRAVHPAMARVRYWREGSDGSISFLSEEGETLLRFGVADGPGFESFEPESAMLTLASTAR